MLFSSRSWSQTDVGTQASVRSAFSSSINFNVRHVQTLIAKQFGLSIDYLDISKSKQRVAMPCPNFFKVRKKFKSQLLCNLFE